MKLENKVASVARASLSIDKAIALAFAEEGALVTVGYRSHPEEAGERGGPDRGHCAKGTSEHTDAL